MKKLITFILVALCACLAVPFVGCGSSDTPDLPDTVKNGEWIEVQSITYYSQGSSKTFTSTCHLDIESEEITQNEYDNAPEIQKSYPLSGLDFLVNRKEYISKLNSWKEKYYYHTLYDYNFIITGYCKEIIKSYELYYVKVRFLENNTLEINYNECNVNTNWSPNDYNTTIRVLPLSYTVTYFND